jgi:hypothetical protein
MGKQLAEEPFSLMGDKSVALVAILVKLTNFSPTTGNQTNFPEIL